MRAIAYRRYAVFLSIVVVGCAVDLGTKNWAFSALGMPDVPGRTAEQVYWIWPDYAGFQTSLNEGALFGIGTGRAGLFALISVLAAVGIACWLFLGGAAVDWLLTVALACVSAGIAGNLYDRLGLHGLVWSHPPRMGQTAYAVRDFILVQASDQWRWPNFNVADSLLVLGAALIAWHAFRIPHPHDARSPGS